MRPPPKLLLRRTPELSKHLMMLWQLPFWSYKIKRRSVSPLGWLKKKPRHRKEKLRKRDLSKRLLNARQLRKQPDSLRSKRKSVQKRLSLLPNRRRDSRNFKKEKRRSSLNFS